MRQVCSSNHTHLTWGCVNQITTDVKKRLDLRQRHQRRQLQGGTKGSTQNRDDPHSRAIQVRQHYGLELDGVLGPMHHLVLIRVPGAYGLQPTHNLLVGLEHAKRRGKMFLRQQKWHGWRGMGYPKDEDRGGLPLLIEMPVPMGIRVPTAMKINVGDNETARRQTLPAHRATPRSRSTVTHEEVIEKGVELSWLIRIRFPRQICRTDCRLRKLVNNTLLEFGKTGCLQEAVFVQIRHNTMNVIGQQDMPAKLLGKSVLDIGKVIPPIELAGNKKGWRREYDLPLNHAFGVAQTDILLPLVLNRKYIDVTECWKCHGGQGYPKRLGASTRHYCPPAFLLAIAPGACYEQYRGREPESRTPILCSVVDAQVRLSVLPCCSSFCNQPMPMGSTCMSEGCSSCSWGVWSFWEALLSSSISYCVLPLRRRTRNRKARSSTWLGRSLHRPRRGPGPRARRRRSRGPWQKKPGDVCR